MTNITTRQRRSRLLRLTLPCSVVAAAAVLASLLLGATASRATSVAMPANVQVALFRKIFSYNKGVDPSRKVLVVYTNDFAAAAGEVRGAFQGLNHPCEAVPVADFSKQTAGVSVVYVLASSVPSAVQDFCAREHVFSVAPIPALAERGEVSVAIGVKEDQKPEIIVHLNRAKAEGQSLPVPLLSLARVIR